MSFAFKALAVFVAVFIGNLCWAQYIKYVGEKKALLAASWDTLILVFGSFVVVSYTSNRWLIVPYLIGGFAGTYYAVWRSK